MSETNVYGNLYDQLEDVEPNVTYTEALKLCEDMGLLEIMMHGEQEYGRLTQKGINVITCLMQLLRCAADPRRIGSTAPTKPELAPWSDQWLSDSGLLRDDREPRPDED